MKAGDHSQIFIEDAGIGWETVAPGIKRKIMTYDDRLMLVKVAFEKGGIGSLHHHQHSQITHIESGVFEIQIGAEKRLLRAGDAYQIPPHIEHGARCIESGVLIDMFSPYREDFV